MNYKEVLSKGQLKGENVIYYENSGKRILFLGNSILLHGKKPEIGWEGSWGMAATSEEKDYFHIIKSALDKDNAFCVAQMADFEREFFKENILENYSLARDFGADIIISKIGANTASENAQKYNFGLYFEKLLKYLNPKEKRVIVCSDFWESEPCDTQMKEVAMRNNYEYVKLNDLGNLPEMSAIGLFEHKGVAAHPGDNGMAEVARRILDIL